MSVTAVLEAPNTKLLYQQTVFCTGKITNNGRRPLANLNPETISATPTLVLTDVQSGATTRYAKRKAQEQVTPSVALQPGATRKFEFSLTERATIPGPGAYDAQLHYTWDGGETLSPAVRFEFAPSNPQTLDLVTGKGGPAPLQYAAFLHRPDPLSLGGDVWVAQLFLAGKPKVQDCTRLDAAKQLIVPRQSVPPNSDCAFQWTAWVQGPELRIVTRKAGTGVAPMSVTLDAPDYRIIPPLLVNVTKSGEPEGVDVLLYRADPAGGGRLLSKRVLLTGKPAGDLTGPLPGMPPGWGCTIYLTNRRRHTFFLAFEQGKQVLKHAAWPTTAGALPAAKTAAAWSSPFGVAAVSLTEDSSVVGAVLVHAGDPAENQYECVTWTLENDQVKLGRVIPITWPDRRRGVDAAVLRVGSSGRPFAILRSSRDQSLHWCSPEGSVTPLAGAAAGARLPADIVFRGGDDPVLLFAESGRGLQLVKPL